jgi:hypothetical protein
MFRRVNIMFKYVFMWVAKESPASFFNQSIQSLS